MMVKTYRKLDGSENNTLDPTVGSTGSNFLRTTPADYEDGVSSLSGTSRPSAREISNEIFAQSGNTPSTEGLSDFLWVWGQFVDHDIDLTKGASAEEDAPISVPTGDPFFDPTGTGTQTIGLTRSGFDPGSGTATPREQVNEITPFLDASMVYGSTAERNADMRADNGYMKVSDGNLLPYNDGSHTDAGPGGGPTFLAGDVRANENVALTSMHTLFVREHNRLVDDLKAKHPDWDSETLYQEAKALVEGEIQAITYNEFLPALLGKDALQTYAGYSPDVNPQIANIFATAAFRVGHTMLSSTIMRVEENGETSEFGHLALRDAFFRPDRLVNEGGIDDVIRGAGVGVSQEIDAHIVDDVRNFLFGPPGAGGFDLASLNIQRGRDHGLSDYNSAREAYGLPKVADWSEITSDIKIQAKLKALYDSVDNIDVWVGGLAEDPSGDAVVGELFATVIADQFLRLRDGDQYWYENRFSGEDLDFLNSVSLSQVIQHNTGITHIQDDMFRAYDRVGGSADDDSLAGGEGRDLIFGLDGDDYLKGHAGDDQLMGDNGDDALIGGAGDDVLYGDDGNDWIVGGRGDDRADGGAGDDTINGNRGDDDLYGAEGDDEIRGGSGADILSGGDGDDTLIGGSGYDTLEGGKGSDVFVFEGTFGHDTITDFDTSLTAGDVLDLSGTGLNQCDLTFESRGNDTVIQVGQLGSITLENIAPKEIDSENHFLFA